MYEALGLDRVSYSQFLRRATPLVVRGLEEGWIRAEIPAAPSPDPEAYQIVFLDADRWADELTAAFATNIPFDERIRTTAVEGDPDLT
jgi:hypothetical protein